MKNLKVFKVLCGLLRLFVKESYPKIVYQHPKFKRSIEINGVKKTLRCCWVPGNGYAYIGKQELLEGYEGFTNGQRFPETFKVHFKGMIELGFSEKEIIEFMHFIEGYFPGDGTLKLIKEKRRTTRSMIDEFNQIHGDMAHTNKAA